MKVVHGSPINISETEDGFKMLDYKFNRLDENCKAPEGNDMFGPGIYTFVAEGSLKKEAVDGAIGYAGKSGFVHFCSVDIDEDRLLNNREPDEISEEQWVEIINEYIANKQRISGHDENKLREILYEFEDDINSQTFDIDRFNERVSEIENFDLDMDDYEDYDNSDEWMEAILCDYEMCDPASHVYDEGGPLAIAQYAMRKSETLWDVITHVASSAAYKSDGTKGFTDNNLFWESFNAVMKKEGDYVGALVFDNKFFVCFDTRELSLDKVVQVKENSREYSL